MVRYADDFVIFHSNLEELQRAASRVTQWLGVMGLSLSPKKTRITHTLTPFQGQVGFDFLGFTIRQFPVGQTHTGKSRMGKPLGFKTLITPSKAAMSCRSSSHAFAILRSTATASSGDGRARPVSVVAGTAMPHHCQKTPVQGSRPG